MTLEQLEAAVADAMGVDRTVPQAEAIAAIEAGGRVIDYLTLDAEVAAYRIPARPYARDWNATMEIREWVARQRPEVVGEFFGALACVVTERLHVNFSAYPDGWEGIANGTWSTVVLATPSDWCHAVLATVKVERA